MYMKLVNTVKHLCKFIGSLAIEVRLCWVSFSRHLPSHVKGLVMLTSISQLTIFLENIFNM